MMGFATEAMDLLRELVRLAREIRDELKRRDRDGAPTV